jgi:hypothetical protein
MVELLRKASHDKILVSIRASSFVMAIEKLMAALDGGEKVRDSGRLVGGVLVST